MSEELRISILLEQTNLELGTDVPIEAPALSAEGNLTLKTSFSYRAIVDYDVDRLGVDER
jgi:hypothetical protein